MHFINLDESNFFLFANDPPYPSHFDEDTMVAHWTPLIYGLGKQFKEATHFARILVLCPAQVLTQTLLSSVLNFSSIRVSETTFAWAWSVFLLFGDIVRRIQRGRTRIEKALNCYGLVVEESHRSTRMLRTLKDTGLLFEDKHTSDERLQYTVQDILPLPDLR
jgi:hypothetical protein